MASPHEVARKVTSQHTPHLDGAHIKTTGQAVTITLPVTSGGIQQRFNTVRTVANAHGGTPHATDGAGTALWHAEMRVNGVHVTIRTPIRGGR